MSTVVEVAGLLCHCTGDEGHEPGTTGCTEAPVRPVAVRPFRAGPTPPRDAARGTCPLCGCAGVKVVGEKRRGAVPSSSSAPAHRVPLGIDVALAAHKCPGKGAGACGYIGPPAEVRFVRSPEIVAWEREYGPGECPVTTAVVGRPPDISSHLPALFSSVLRSKLL